jgi:peptidyl-prolyl cis-trans isomerase SurA
MVLVLAMIMPAFASAQSGRTETIAAVVNEDAVSESDVSDRMKLIMVSSGMPNTKEVRDRIRPRIVSMLIDEKLKLQEAERLEIEISSEEIEEGFASIAGRNSFSPDQFRMILRKEGVSPKTLEDQVRSEIAWSRVIQSEIRPQVMITDNETDAVIQRLEMNRGKTEYRVFEIFLPVEKPSEESDVRKLSDRLTRQLVEQRVPFQRLASQFSQAAGAANGGDMGWVQEGQLPEELDEILGRMKKGEISQPVRSLAGYHILYLREKRMMTAETMPSREEIMNRLGMERIDRLQRSYLLDLKADAFIEQRV